jgi:hypothetical protein
MTGEEEECTWDCLGGNVKKETRLEDLNIEDNIKVDVKEKNVRTCVGFV